MKENLTDIIGIKLSNNTCDPEYLANIKKFIQLEMSSVSKVIYTKIIRQVKTAK